MMEALRWAECSHARGYSQAERFFEQQGPKSTDLLITDKELCSMSGFEFAQKVSEWDPPLYIPIIMVGADFTKNEVVKAARCGIRELLIKPVHPRTLKGKINAASNPTAKAH